MPHSPGLSVGGNFCKRSWLRICRNPSVSASQSWDNRSAPPCVAWNKYSVSSFCLELRTEYFCFTVYRPWGFTHGQTSPEPQFSRLPCRTSHTSLVERVFVARGMASVSWKLHNTCHILALGSHPPQTASSSARGVGGMPCRALFP